MATKRKQRVMLTDKEKAEAVKALATKSAAEVAKEYNVAVSAVHRWKHQTDKKSDPTGDLIKELTVFLEHAEKAIFSSGQKKITGGESYAMLALTHIRRNY